METHNDDTRGLSEKKRKNRIILCRTEIVISRLGQHGAFFCPLFLRVADPRMQNKINKIDEVNDANF